MTVGTTSAGNSTFQYRFQFDNGKWGTDAAKKIYVLRYDVLITSPVSNTGLVNSVSSSNTGYSLQGATATVSYTFNQSEIDGIANSYGRIEIRKQTSASGHAAFGGATFTITDQNGFVRTATTASNGVAAFVLLPLNSVFTIRETASPNGFSDVGLPRVIATGVKVVGSGDGTYTYDPSADNLSGTLSPTAITDAQKYTFIVRNHPSPFTINFKKLDQYSRAVAGVEFTVYRANDTTSATSLMTATSTSSGIVSFDLSTLGVGAYNCKETAAPPEITIDLSTVPEYYFTLDVHGNSDGLHVGSIAGTVITTIENITTNPPPITPTTNHSPGGGHGGGTPDSPSPKKPEDPAWPVTPAVTQYSPEAIAAWNAAQQALLKTQKLPKTGGFVGSALLFLLGGALVGCGIYVGNGNIHVPKDSAGKMMKKTGRSTRIGGRRKRKRDGE